MRRLALLSLAVIAVLAGGCGGGPKVTENREVSEFDRIRIEDSADVTVTIGSPMSVSVRAGDDVIDRVKTRVDGDTLEVEIGGGGITIGPDPASDAEVHVTVPSLAGVRVDGSGDAELNGLFADNLELEIDGSGNLEAAGRVDRLRLDLRGSGDADLYELETRIVEVTSEGSGNADIFVTGDLEARVVGSGDVSYRGDPRVNSRVEGSGDLSQEG